MQFEETKKIVRRYSNFELEKIDNQRVNCINLISHLRINLKTLNEDMIEICKKFTLF